MHLEVLVEELSAKIALDLLLPKIVGEAHSFVVHNYQGKSDLLDSLLARLRGYARRFKSDPSTANWRIVILVDEDRTDCRQLKGRLVACAEQASLRDRILARIIIEELEAWFFGDVEALCMAYPKIPATLAERKGFRNPDAIRGGTWEALDRLLKKYGYPAGLQKIATAESIAQHMDPDRNLSHSFQVFRQDILKLIQE